jgi:hypothetical protein
VRLGGKRIAIYLYHVYGCVLNEKHFSFLRQHFNTVWVLVPGTEKIPMLPSGWDSKILCAGKMQTKKKKID